MRRQRRHGLTAARYAPLLGAIIGALGGVVYWLGAQIWPASIAVALSMLATVLISAGIDARATVRGRFASVGFVFAVLVKYNALMALTAASLPFALPPNLALGLIMVAGQASSRALGVPAAAPAARGAEAPASSHADIAIALTLGFAPAALIGIPGLIGLVAAIAGGAAIAAYIRRRRPSAAAQIGMVQQQTEICFYLGALASWSYI
jgi:adenosylcobinamide-GDP ribazoletransferase